MIKITIEQITLKSWEETQHKLVKSTPTEILENDSSYGVGSRQRVKCIEEYAPMAVTVYDTKRTKLLEQEIESDAAFDLVKVIAAINGMGETKQ